MRFEVPQFIEIEDKIFGPLTWRQFVYVGSGAAVGMTLFFTAPFTMFLLIGIPFGMLSFLLGFYPINNRPFSIFLEAILRYFQGTRLYLWKKTGTGVYGEDSDWSSSPATFEPVNDGEVSRLNSLSRSLDLK
ncbi:MAG: PrgI family protein [Bacteroidota bacterium]